MRAANRIVWMPALLGLLLGLAGCGGYYGEGIDLDSDEAPEMQVIRDAYAQEKFYETINLAKQFIRVKPGSRFLDEAQFLLARAEYEEENYIEAEDRFRKVMRDFPSSAFAEEAAYHLALAILSQSRKAELDQRETLAARTQLQSFLVRYPDSDLAPRAREHLENISLRLAKKDYINGETYRKMKRYRSAIFYYEKVSEEWGDTQYAEKSLFRLADVSKSREEWDDVLAYTRRYLAVFPEGEHLEKIQEFREEAQRRVDSAEARESEGR